jgi:predicted AAA+ superfamily ATPase
LLKTPDRSFFLFGPRGTGKSTWLRQRLGGVPYFDLLDSDVYLELTASPRRLEDRLPRGYRGFVVIDEIQRIPELLNEVHRLIETRRLRFALTGSSARKLRGRGVNLLAGRALTRTLHPLTAIELGARFDVRRALALGHLPAVCMEPDASAARAFLRSYVDTYVREEVQQEGLTRNIAAFHRFLEAASLSQGAVLNVAAVARECQVERRAVESYFGIVEDLLLGTRVPAFTRRAKRRVALHPKFYFFDAGVYRALRPRGPLDTEDEVDGAAFETLLLQELRAHNAYADLGYTIHYWRTPAGHEVDMVLYGERGLLAFETKRTSKLRAEDLRGLHALLADYPMARARLVYGGTRRYHEGPIEVLPLQVCLEELPELLSGA